MLDNRETALLIWLFICLVIMFVSEKIRSSIVGVVSAALRPKIAFTFLALILWTVLLVLIGNRIGIWATDLIAGTVYWFLISAIAMYVNSERVRKHEKYLRRIVLETIGMAVFLEFFLNFYVLPLYVEFLLLPIVVALLLLSAVAALKTEYRNANILIQTMLSVIGIGIIVYVCYRFVKDWREIDPYDTLWEFLLPIWLTFGVIPFIYALSLYIEYDAAYTRMKLVTESMWVRTRAVTALVLRFQFRRLDLAVFNHSWIQRFVYAPSLRASYRVAGEYRSFANDARNAEREKLSRSEQYAGVAGTDEHGKQLDQREFESTICALRLLATAQMGWHRNRGGVYRPDLLSILTLRFEGCGLPPDHDIELHVADDGQAWWAWRRTITGWCFAIGAAEPPPDEWLFDGPEPPTDFPGKSGEWGARWGVDALNW